MTQAEWLELESDPGLFTLLLEDIGVKGVQVEEVYDLSRPMNGVVYGFIFLFRWDVGKKKPARRSGRGSSNSTSNNPSDSHSGDTSRNNHLTSNSPSCNRKEYKSSLTNHDSCSSNKSDSTNIDSDAATGVDDHNKHDNLFFAQQIVQNSCATHALLSILFNRPELELGDMLEQFRTATKLLSPQAKGLAIGSMPQLSQAHNRYAQPSNTAAAANNRPSTPGRRRSGRLGRSSSPDASSPSSLQHPSEAVAAAVSAALSLTPTNTTSGYYTNSLDSSSLCTTGSAAAADTFHFVCFLPFDGFLYELDGLSPDPINHGPLQDASSHWTVQCAEILKQRMQEQDLHYSLLALVPDKRLELELKMATLTKNRQTIETSLDKLAAASTTGQSLLTESNGADSWQQRQSASAQPALDHCRSSLNLATTLKSSPPMPSPALISPTASFNTIRTRSSSLIKPSAITTNHHSSSPSLGAANNSQPPEDIRSITSSATSSTPDVDGNNRQIDVVTSTGSGKRLGSPPNHHDNSDLASGVAKRRRLDEAFIFKSEGHLPPDHTDGQVNSVDKITSPPASGLSNLTVSRSCLTSPLTIDTGHSTVLTTTTSSRPLTRAVSKAQLVNGSSSSSPHQHPRQQSLDSPSSSARRDGTIKTTNCNNTTSGGSQPAGNSIDLHDTCSPSPSAITLSHRLPRFTVDQLRKLLGRIVEQQEICSSTLGDERCKHQSYRTDHARRVHNYDPFIKSFLLQLHRHNLLNDLVSNFLENNTESPRLGVSNSRSNSNFRRQSASGKRTNGLDNSSRSSNDDHHRSASDDVAADEPSGSVTPTTTTTTSLLIPDSSDSSTNINAADSTVVVGSRRSTRLDEHVSPNSPTAKPTTTSGSSQSVDNDNKVEARYCPADSVSLLDQSLPESSSSPSHSSTSSLQSNKRSSPSNQHRKSLRPRLTVNSSGGPKPPLSRVKSDLLLLRRRHQHQHRRRVLDLTNGNNKRNDGDRSLPARLNASYQFRRRRLC